MMQPTDALLPRSPPLPQHANSGTLRPCLSLEWQHRFIYDSFTSSAPGFNITCSQRILRLHFPLQEPCALLRLPVLQLLKQPTRLKTKRCTGHQGLEERDPPCKLQGGSGTNLPLTSEETDVTNGPAASNRNNSCLPSPESRAHPALEPLLIWRGSFRGRVERSHFPGQLDTAPKCPPCTSGSTHLNVFCGSVLPGCGRP